MTMTTHPTIVAALAVLDELGATGAVPEVRALVARAGALEQLGVITEDSATELRGELVTGLADGTTNATEAGDRVVEVARRRDALAAAVDLVADARALVLDRVGIASRTAGDAWIVALRPAVGRLADALTKAAKLTDGQLADLEAGGGTAAQRTVFEAVSDALPLAGRAQEAAHELRREGIVPTAVLAGAELEKWRLALEWQDVTPIEQAWEKRDRLDLGDTARLIAAHRDRGVIPAMRTADEVVEAPGEGPRTISEEAAREQVRCVARREAQEREDAHLDVVARVAARY